MTAPFFSTLPPTVLLGKNLGNIGASAELSVLFHVCKITCDHTRFLPLPARSLDYWNTNTTKIVKCQIFFFFLTFLWSFKIWKILLWLPGLKKKQQQISCWCHLDLWAPQFLSISSCFLEFVLCVLSQNLRYDCAWELNWSGEGTDCNALACGQGELALFCTSVWFWWKIIPPPN